MIFLLTVTQIESSKKKSDYYSNVENYIGPSSYTTSFGSDYPSFGNYGSQLNTQNPGFSSSYSIYGGNENENKEFGSTSYFNYPPTEIRDASPTYQPPFSQSSPSFSSSSSSVPSSQPSWPSQYSNSFSSSSSSGSSSGSNVTPLSQHIEVTKPIVVPVYKSFPYPVSKKFPVAIPHPVLVPYPSPYAVHVEISTPEAHPVIREVIVPIEKKVLYPVEKAVPVEVAKPVEYKVEKLYPVYVPKHVPVKVKFYKIFL
jgi:hypothetical protein